MAVVILKAALEALKGITELSKKVIDEGDPEKYAKSVSELNQGVSSSYEAMRNIIINSKSFSDEEKVKRLAELAEQEEASKQKCSEAIRGNRENVAKIAMEVFKGFLTCGISFAPAIVRSFKKALAENGDEESVIELEEIEARSAESFSDTEETN